MSDKKFDRQLAKQSVGKFVETKCGEVLLIVDNDFPIMRAFDGHELITLNAKTIERISNDKMDFPRNKTLNKIGE